MKQNKNKKITAIRAHSTNREWKVIKRMLKNNDVSIPYYQKPLKFPFGKW